MQLFLSPHPDDVVLSCGALLHKLIHIGETVAVWTLMAQDAPPEIQQHPFIEQLHSRWDLGDCPYTARRAEDRHALQQLGLDQQVYYGDWHDALYRSDQHGQLLYQGDDDLFGVIKNDDPLIGASLDFSIWENLTHIYAPLGAGNHVDHQVVRQALLRNMPEEVAILFYEEYPYSAETSEVYHAHAGEQARLYGLAAIQQAGKAINKPLIGYVQSVDEVSLEAKIAAIAAYQSQLSSFWNSVEDMQNSVRQYAASVGHSAGIAYGERIWFLSDQHIE